jgi:hypothetical protein
MRTIDDLGIGLEEPWGKELVFLPRRALPSTEQQPFT